MLINSSKSREPDKEIFSMVRESLRDEPTFFLNLETSESSTSNKSFFKYTKSWARKTKKKCLIMEGEYRTL